jgi:hypothetical protein
VKLPHVEDARVDRTKIVDYLLALEHQEGPPKRLFFFALASPLLIGRHLQML